MPHLRQQYELSRQADIFSPRQRIDHTAHLIFRLYRITSLSASGPITIQTRRFTCRIATLSLLSMARPSLRDGISSTDSRSSLALSALQHNTILADIETQNNRVSLHHAPGHHKRARKHLICAKAERNASTDYGSSKEARVVSIVMTVHARNHPG